MKKKIMIADDDTAILEATSLMLEDAGYSVIATTDGEMLPVMHVEKPDLLLLDIRLSGLNGRDACIKIKNDAYGRNIPVILFSANKDTEQIAQEAGADGFIAKPFQMNDLLVKIATHVGTFP